MNLKELFPIPSVEQWQKIILKELKEIPYDSLTNKNEDGIKIPPIEHPHQDYEQPIDTHFPEYVSFCNFPYSNIGFCFNSFSDLSNHNLFSTLFLSLPYENLLNQPSYPNSYVLIKNFFHIDFFSILPQIPELYSKFKGWILDLSYLQESGANNIDTLSLGLFILEKIKIHDSPIIIKLAISNDFYAEISKLRAFNYILQNYGFQNVKIWAKTAEINKSYLHLENNLIRLTTETVAAVLGGCDYISIIPFDLNYQEEFGIRISANILRLLKHESYLDKVSDPLRGSYSIEKLTHSYTTHIFQQLLFWKSLSTAQLWKIFTQRALENLQKIVDLYKNQEKLFIGVNIYPYAQETRQEVKINFPNELKPVRIAQLI